MQETSAHRLRLTTVCTKLPEKPNDLDGIIKKMTFAAILLVSDHEAQISSSNTIVLDACFGDSNNHFPVCRYPFH